MEESEVRRIVEEIDPDGDISPALVDELVYQMKEALERKEGDKRGDATYHTLREEFEIEPDWRKRASLAAKMVSVNLDK